MGYCLLFILYVSNFAVAKEQEVIDLEWTVQIEEDLEKLNESDVEIDLSLKETQALVINDTTNSKYQDEQGASDSLAPDVGDSELPSKATSTVLDAGRVATSSENSIGITSTTASATDPANLEDMIDAVTSTSSQVAGSETLQIASATDEAHDDLITATTSATSTIIESVAGGGMWHAATTWIGGVVPNAKDIVVITDGVVSSYNEMSVKELRINQGAEYRARNNSNFYSKQVNIQTLVNNGRLSSEPSVQLVIANLQNNGTVSGSLAWAGGRDGQFETTQVNFSKLELLSDLETELPLKFQELKTNSSTLYLKNNPEITIYKQNGNMRALGVGRLILGENQDSSYAGLTAPDSIVTYKPGYFPKPIQAKEIIFDENWLSGSYKIATDITITADIFRLENGASVRDSAGSSSSKKLLLDAKVINDGYFVGDLDLIISNDFLNLRGVDVSEVRISAPSNAHTYKLVVGDDVLSGETGQLVNGIGGDVQDHVSDKNLGTQIIFYESGIETGDRIYLNVPFEKIENPYRFTQTVWFSEIEQQAANDQFHVTIKTGSDYTGPLYLKARLGDVAPNKVYVENGRWSGDVTLFEQADRQHLYVNQGNYLGWSNPFNVRPGNLVESSFLTGYVYDGTLQDKPRLDNQTVYLYRDNPETAINSDVLVATAETGALGTFAFNAVQCGSYYISAEPEEAAQRNYHPINVPCANFAHIAVPSTQCSPSEKRPVLLLPGIMGSTVPGTTSLYPVLTPHRPDWNSGDLVVHDLDNIIANSFEENLGFTQLEDTLVKDHGYVSGCDVFQLPYDWTLSVPEISQHYLQPWIEHAKKMSGQDQVDIVAHSMGGLVAREYIQGKNYKNDVGRFVMVGTPNKGSLDTYPAWAGGDPVTADKISGSSQKIFGKNFQTQTINKNYVARKEGEAPCQLSENAYCETQRVYDFLHEQAVSVGNLLPTFENPLTGYNSELVEHKNSFLEQLNGVCGNNCQAYTPLEEVIETENVLVLYGATHDINNTVRSLATTAPQGDLYTDGQVSADDEHNYSAGDEVVLSESAKLDGVVSVSAGPGAHRGLVRGSVPQIIQFITKP